MYLGKVKWEKVQAAREKYLSGIPEGETRSAHFDWSMLKQFIDEVDNYAASANTPLEDVGIVFIRGGLRLGNSAYEKLPDGNVQLNLAFVAKFGDEALVLEPGGESTGLCPKNCGKI